MEEGRRGIWGAFTVTLSLTGPRTVGDIWEVAPEKEMTKVFDVIGDRLRKDKALNMVSGVVFVRFEGKTKEQAHDILLDAGIRNRINRLVAKIKPGEYVWLPYEYLLEDGPNLLLVAADAA